jgi:glutathione S-transferase
MPRLYDFPLSGDCYKVRLLMAQLGIACERVHVDILSAGRPAEFQARHPSPELPRLELDDGTVLAESGAILFYLAEGTPLLPDDRAARAQVLSWMFYEQSSVEPNLAAARWWLSIRKQPELRRDQLAFWYEASRQALAVLERHLDGNDFFAAARYTIADIAIYCTTHVAGEAGFDLRQYPRLSAWLQRVRSQPGHVGMMDED